MQTEKIIIMNNEKEYNLASEKSAINSSIKLMPILVIIACNMLLPFIMPIFWIVMFAVMLLPLCKLLVRFNNKKIFTYSVMVVFIVPFRDVPVLKQNVSPVSQFTEQTYRQPQTATWRYLGEKVISFSTEKDLIHVKKVGVFRKLKFKVMDAPVKIGSMQVAFENGEVQNISLLLRVGEGRESKVIDLTETDASIKVVYFSYRPEQQGDKRKPTIILLGQQ